MALNRDDEARAALARSIAIDPGQAAAHRHLSHLLDAIGDHEEAIRHQREVTRITPDDAREHYNLGCKLMARGHLDDAIREFDETLRLRPDDAEAHCNRGQVLLHQERPREALESFQRGHELGSKRADWAHPSKEWVESARWRVEFADRMERMLSGEEQPRDAAERVRLATLLSRRARHTEAARMWTEAFAEDNALAEDLSRNHRYNAACAAALAAEAGGADAAAWRGQTLEWLRADLAARAKDVAGLVKRLQHWKSDPDLAGVRDRIDGLPEPERGGWRSFWAQVDEALAAARTAAGSAAR
jgi:tetratricopeptide (TPR) repeat protein